MKHFSKRVLFFLSAIAATFLIGFSGGVGGCSGSSGGGAISVNSLDGAAGVPVDSSFRYAFAQLIDQSSVTGASYFIVPAAGVAADVVKSSVNPAICDPANALPASVVCPSINACDLTPGSDLNDGTQYSICLTSGITYFNGGSFTGFMATFTAGGGGSYTVGGEVTGLGAGEQVVLQNNGADDISLTANGSFTFATALADGAAYAVTVFTAPAGKTCTVDNGTGTIAGADVADVSVVCSSSAFTVGGEVTGLGAGEQVVLQNNSADDLTVTADGAFTFAAAVADGATYAVTVFTEPAGKTCAVENGTGTIAGANVADVSVVCSVRLFTVGGTVTGMLLGDTITLQNNGTDDLEVSADGSFTFATALPDGSAYDVTVKGPRLMIVKRIARICFVKENGSGTISGADVTNVVVACEDPR